MRSDPRVWIGPPFQDCPNCKSLKSFGVFLTVTKSSYHRRCKSCLHQEGFSLLPVEKKVVYLDQFAVSNMAASQNPEWQNDLKEFWVELWRLLNRLVFLQLIACPASNFHYEESVVSSLFDAKRFVYDALSAGADFRDFETIRRAQLQAHSRLWIKGKGPTPPTLRSEDAFGNSPNTWQPRLRIGVRIPPDAEVVSQLEKIREEVNEGLRQVFEAWAEIDDFNFWEVFREEARSYGRSLLSVVLTQANKLARDSRAAIELLRDGVPEALVKFTTTRLAIEQEGFSGSESLEMTVKYLMSNDLEQLPFNRISSLVYAGLARKAATGQKKPPTRGMTADIKMISTLLPYCDAMFVDKECGRS